MPNPLFVPIDPEIQGTVVDRLLGRRRSTKTWLPTTKLSGRLGILRNHSQRLLLTFRNLHRQLNHDSNIADDELKKLYPCIMAYEGLHLEVTEHLGSYKGFLARQATGSYFNDEDKPADSTAGLQQLPTQPAKPGEPQQAVVAMKMK